MLHGGWLEEKIAEGRDIWGEEILKKKQTDKKKAILGLTMSKSMSASQSKSIWSVWVCECALISVCKCVQTRQLAVIEVYRRILKLWNPPSPTSRPLYCYSLIQLELFRSLRKLLFNIFHCVSSCDTIVIFWAFTAVPQTSTCTNAKH